MNNGHLEWMITSPPAAAGVDAGMSMRDYDRLQNPKIDDIVMTTARLLTF
jgi:hypothetical protein